LRTRDPIRRGELGPLGAAIERSREGVHDRFVYLALMTTRHRAREVASRARVTRRDAALSRAMRSLLSRRLAEQPRRSRGPRPRRSRAARAHARFVALATASIALLFALSPAAAGQDAHRSLLITGAHVLDPRAERWIDGAGVLVIDGRITSVAADAATKAPPSARKIDAQGLYLLPGLIDLHSHLLLHPYDETPWDDQVLKESLELRTIRATAAARATLEAGFTTLRDLGTEGAGFADVALRDAIAKNMIPGPRVFASTRAIVATGCYGPSGFDPRWVVPRGAQEADGADGVRKAVREQIAAGADWIKVYADYRRAKGAKATPTFSEVEIEAAVSEARSAGLRVAAHATTDEGIRRAVQAGVATIEHGYAASDETLALMREKNVVLCPTLAAGEAIARYAGWKGGAPEPASISEERATFARALRSGVVIACGSDVGVFRHGDNAREIELMVAYGMQPAAAIRAATSVAATVLGREKELGRIGEGAAADMIAVAGDPLADVSQLRRPVIVVRDGAVAFERR
jgi:imidazolonepropionase-like amidohydrolase